MKAGHSSWPPLAGERRAHPRVPVDLALSVERLDRPDGMGHGIDMSLGGLRFQCLGLAVTRAELVRVHFTFGGGAFSIFGRTLRVRRLDDFAQEVALAFTGMKPETRSLLRRRLYAV